MNDVHFMRHALRLAARNLGQAWPNPAVGAVAVKEGRVLGAGWTSRGGRPHAEPQALKQAGEDTRGATLYVTLEPCAHAGKTPPCTEGIIDSGVVRVVIACRDPHPQVNGAGVAALQRAGIAVTEDVCSVEAQALNEGFFSVLRRGRPHVSLKIATSLDGCIATATGESRWITGEAARAYGHLLRSRHDAILTGIGTALADDPLLTCRLPGLEDCSPVRVVLDSRKRLPSSGKLAQTAHITPLWVEENGHDLNAMLAGLAARGITRLLVEAGPALSTAFLEAGLADTLYWFSAPFALGGEGRGALGALPLLPLEQVPRWVLRRSLGLGPDTLNVYTRA